MYVWVERGVAEDTLLLVAAWFLGTWKWPLVWRTVKEEHTRQDKGQKGLKVWRQAGVCLRKVLGVVAGSAEVAKNLEWKLKLGFDPLGQWRTIEGVITGPLGGNSEGFFQ